MSKPAIILTGFMGTGKSSVGRLIAARTGRRFIDTDELIKARAGRSIAAIFAESGETTFRALEREIAQELTGKRDVVIATGGGLMLEPVNAQALGADAHVFCLTADVETILARTQPQAESRPLIAGSDPASRVLHLLRDREPDYALFEPVSTTGRAPETIADEIVAAATGTPVPPATALHIQAPDGDYRVVVGFSLLARWRKLASWDGPAAVITDDNVEGLYAYRLAPVQHVAVVPAGEQYKRLESVRELYDELLAAGLDRAGAVATLGGGVVGDMGGFVAATFLRGVTLVQCPTTLLAMVDASVGGKTGVDLPQGKNLVGAFKQPRAVIADAATLETLPASEFAAGLAEVVKHGLIGAPELLAQLTAAEWHHAVATAPARRTALRALIVAAVKVKRDVVEADPYEQGRRALLNLGHTFAHAIEQASDYQIRHGEAVAMGLVAAANLSHRLGHCPAALQTQIEEILRHCGLPERIPQYLETDTMLRVMGRDKKKAAGALRFVLLRGVGEVFITADVPEPAVRETLAACRVSVP